MKADFERRLIAVQMKARRDGVLWADLTEGNTYATDSGKAFPSAAELHNYAKEKGYSLVFVDDIPDPRRMV